MKFTILLLCEVDILLSISISSLDVHLHSLPPTGVELSYSAMESGGDRHWMKAPEVGIARLQLIPDPSWKIPPPWHTWPGCCCLVLGQAACACRKKMKSRFGAAL